MVRIWPKITWTLRPATLLWLVCLPIIAAPAARAQSSLSPREWLGELTARGPISCECPHLFAFVKETAGGKTELLDLDEEKFQNDSFWDLVNADELAFTRRMNREPDGKNRYPAGSEDPSEAYAEIFRTTMADTILLTPKKGERWTIVRPNNKGRPEQVFAAKKPADTSAAGVRAWLMQKLGYQGFLLDQRDRFVLVATFAAVSSSANALLLAGTAGNLRIKQDDAQGGALLKLVSCDEGICIFEKLIDNGKKAVRGEKVVF